jgi:hypothetical protein
MIAKHAPRVLALLLAVTVATMATEALAYCASCNGGAPAAYSVGYAAPVSYTAAYAPTYTAAYAPTYTAAYAPAYTTAYAPAYTSYYGSTWAERRAYRRSLWGYPTTAYYAPTYTAAYAPTYTAAYAPTYTAAYAPTVAYAAPVSTGCSTCSACTASYAPACSTCGVSTVSYAAAPVACEACAAAGTPCASCAAGNVSQAAFVESVPMTSSGTTVTTPAEPQPQLAPTDNVPTTRDVQKPVTPAPGEHSLQPEPRGDSNTTPSATTPDSTPATSTTEETTTNIQAPRLFDPNDHTAATEKPHRAPVWTAVLHKTSAAKSTTQNVSWSPEVQANADGWESASKKRSNAGGSQSLSK